MNTPDSQSNTRTTITTPGRCCSYTECRPSPDRFKGSAAQVRCLAFLLGLCLLAPAGFAAEQTVRTCFGLCDASAAVWLDSQTFAVADDEDNVIRVYSRQGNGLPLCSVEVSDFLKVEPKEPETDLEGAARIGDLVFWITSHGRSAKGKERLSRQRLFATRTVVHNGVPLVGPTGRPYTRLLRDLANDPRLQRFDLAAAAALPPKARDGLNIEGLAATPDGHLLVGFRNPIPLGKALLLPLLNPAEMIAGGAAKLGDPVLLPLAGLGIRSLTEWQGRYLIVAGSYDGEAKSCIYAWAGPGHNPTALAQSHFGALNPEALAMSPGGNLELLVVSDDGNVLIGNKPCKRLKEPMERRFRAAILPWDHLLPTLGPAGQ